MERLAIEEGKEKGKQEGKQEGIQEGRQEGIRESIVDALTVRFGEVSDEIVTQLDQVGNVDVLRSILRQAITVDSLDAFVQLFPEAS
jgi:predicted transposase YdaD